MSATATVRRASVADLADLRPLVAAYHEFEGITAATADATLAALLQPDTALGGVWVLAEGDQLLGYLALCHGYSIELGGRDAFIDEFYLHPEARGMGLGTRLLEAAAESARSAGVVALHLEVARDNTRAQKLYTQLGFAPRARFSLMTRRLDKQAGGPD